MKKVIGLMLLILVLVTVFAYYGDNISKAAENTSEQKTDLSNEKKWIDSETNKVKYPITVDSNQWKEFKTHEEMLKACTIPEKLLNTLTTDDLIELVLDYPLVCDIFAYNSLQEGFEAIKQQYNGLYTLMSRNDAADKLLSKYQEIKIISESIPSDKDDIKAILEDIYKSDVLKDEFIRAKRNLYDVTLLELILSQDEIINDFSTDKINTLNNVALSKYKEKVKSKIFEGLEDTYFESMLNSKNRVLLDDFVTVKSSYQTQKSNQSLLSSTEYVYTPNGTPVLVYINDYFGTFIASIITDDFINAYPYAEMVQYATNVYNCHSYAWYSQNQSSFSGKWMDYPNSYIYDGSYSYVGLSPTAINQKAVWMSSGEYIHSGIVYNLMGRITSKWGQGPLFIHAASYSPYSGSVYYYTR